MLPKVATHILHTTSRAAAAVQNQTNAIRNVLQLQSSGPSAGSGSNRAGNGPSPGGAKYNTGSRFYTGFNGAGRAVTHANLVTSHDGSTLQVDESDEFAPRRPVLKNSTPKRPRIRSSSLSINVQGRHERGEKLGVLKTVQLHARTRHAFAPQADSFVQESTPQEVISSQHSLESTPRTILTRRNSTSSSDGVESLPSPAVSVRRNSTVAHVDSSATPDMVMPPTPTSLGAQSPVDPSSPQSIEDPSPLLTPAYGRLKNAARSKDYIIVAEAVNEFRRTTTNPNTAEYNMALAALYETRRSGEPLRVILDVYNEMLSKSLVPNARTYLTLIFALTDRDYEVTRMLNSMEIVAKRQQIAGRFMSGSEVDEKRIESLRAENNFSSAMSLFSAFLVTAGKRMCTVELCTALIRSCAYHGSIEGAIQVFSQIERRPELKPSALIYRYMIKAYSNAGNLKGAELIFNDYVDACKNDRIFWNTQTEHNKMVAERWHIMVWNQMIESYFRLGMPEKAVEIVDRMLTSKASSDFNPTEVPVIASSTFTAVLSGFCQMGDVTTALAWFDRLLLQGQASVNPFQGLGGQPIKPDSVAWSVMIDSLATQGMVEDLNRLFKVLIQESQNDSTSIHQDIRLLVFTANIEHMKSLNDTTALETLRFLKDEVIPEGIWGVQERNMLKEIGMQYLSRGMYQLAVELLGEIVLADTNRLQNSVDGPEVAGLFNALQKFMGEFTREIYARVQQNRDGFTFPVALQLSRLARAAGLKSSPSHAPYFIHTYTDSLQAGSLPVDDINEKDWQHIFENAVYLTKEAIDGNVDISQFKFNGLLSVLHDIASQGLPIETLKPDTVAYAVKILSSQHSIEQLREAFERFGPSYIRVLEETTQARHVALEEALSTPSPSQELKEYGMLSIDSQQTKSIEERLLYSTSGSPTDASTAVFEAYERFEEGLQRGKAPTPSCISRLIQALGRLKAVDQVHEVYNAAQNVLLNLDKNKKWQTDGWFLIEDGMVVAMAHAGDLDAAHIHRSRILEQGGAPSANAYGALILYVKDTTDDSSNALALFNESQGLGVRPNQYLYNNIISKLSKARKADHALELFQEMKASGIPTSSITYGAVIGACARVGDVHSAEMLFSEMVKSSNFKPRVPPYNTMMQLYTTTKPHRERALFFYNEMLKAHVQPTAHTYKLLLDAYGAIEPVDIASMEQVFSELKTSRHVKLQGTHFAALINAYGCVQKDLDRAISVFDSISTHTGIAPDAVVFESIINALVAHRRTDLIPEYINKMNAAGVHMTAYIANFLIKGFAIVGDIERARGIFESLVDPPTGIAAPNNHASHDPENAQSVDHMDPVYREPSTWEAMVRAELGSGNRDRAFALLERLQARQYPEAVYNRISGVMVDHSVVVS